jgi:hypothetical protein
MHYNNLDDKDEIDFHRFVVMINHEFSERLRLFTEVELEHSLAGDDKPGEVELEQAYVEMDLDDEGRHRGKAGVFLVPVGFLNETHEPPTFYGVERNSVEKNIIPTTWWEGGLGFSGQMSDNFGYDLAFTSGLAVPTDVSDDDAKKKAYKIRNGRKKVAEAPGADGAWTGRLRYKTAGLDLGGTLHYQQDITQGVEVGDGDALLYEAHVAVEKGPFALKALYARWDLEAQGAKDLGRDEQTGWYIEPSWRINEHFGIFARYSEWDNSAGNSDNTEVEQWDVGISWWPHEDVVIKLDYQNQDEAGDQDGFNLGVGYQF